MYNFDIENKKIFVAGHQGMVGSAICRQLETHQVDILNANRSELDLTNDAAVKSWIKSRKPDIIILAAAKVGGIHANEIFPVDFLLENLKIQNNVIEAAFKNDVSKLLFLGSSCIYPKSTNQPIAEEQLLSGYLEPTNEFYAVAKIAGLKLCQAYMKQYSCDYIAAMPTNLYGPEDNFHPEHSHVPAALMRRFHNGKLEGREKVKVWGSGRPKREFLHVDDLASACIHLLKHYSGTTPVNIGTGKDISITGLANLIKKIIGYEGEITYDSSKPDGTMLKRLDVQRLDEMGWSAKISLKDGLESTYRWAVENGKL